MSAGSCEGVGDLEKFISVTMQGRKREGRTAEWHINIDWHTLQDGALLTMCRDHFTSVAILIYAKLVETIQSSPNHTALRSGRMPNFNIQYMNKDTQQGQWFGDRFGADTTERRDGRPAADPSKAVADVTSEMGKYWRAGLPGLTVIWLQRIGTYRDAKESAIDAASLAKSIQTSERGIPLVPWSKYKVPVISVDHYVWQLRGRPLGDRYTTLTARKLRRSGAQHVSMTEITSGSFGANLWGES